MPRSFGGSTAVHVDSRPKVNRSDGLTRQVPLSNMTISSTGPVLSGWPWGPEEPWGPLPTWGDFPLAGVCPVPHYRIEKSLALRALLSMRRK